MSFVMLQKSSNFAPDFERNEGAFIFIVPLHPKTL